MIQTETASFLQSNLEAHRRKWNFAPAAGAVDAAAAGIWADLHGPDPMAGAAAWLAQTTAGRAIPETVCVIGAGHGYVVDVIATQSPGRVLVLEPEPAALSGFFARRDWRALIDAGRLMVLAGPAFEGSQAAWRLFGDGSVEPMVLVHPVLGRVHPEVTRRAAQVIGRARQGAAGNEEARRKFAAPYLINTLCNARVSSRSTPVDVLMNRYRGVPIVVAAAGPSLNRNIEELRPWRDRVVLLAVDTALKPLLAANMAPDFVVALDPSDANARHLTGITVPESTALVAEPSIAASSFAAFGDRVFIFRVAEHHPWPWLRKMGIDCGLLRAWGSVVTSTFDLALRMGGDPVVCIGTDLAYTNGQPYARGTTYEEDWIVTAGPDRSIEWVWEQIVAKKGVPAEGIGGAAVRSAKGLVVFRDWLVEDSKRPGMPRLVNATGAGILQGGTFQLASLDNVLASSPRVAVAHSGMSGLLRGAAAIASGVDHHLLQALLDSRPLPAAPPPSGVQPYRSKGRKARIAETKALRASRGIDLERWTDRANYDRSWEQGPACASRLVPPGSRVLDLGAGIEILEPYLPAGCRYTPLDVVAHSSRTVVADLDRDELPSGDVDVAAMFGVLEFIHDIPRVLTAARRCAPLALVTYCARTSDDLDVRLERGFVNDCTRNELVLRCQKAGWQIVFATRLVVAPGFDHWLFALRGE